jgi:hypothetical protein
MNYILTINKLFASIECKSERRFYLKISRFLTANTLSLTLMQVVTTLKLSYLQYPKLNVQGK